MSPIDSSTFDRMESYASYRRLLFWFEYWKEHKNLNLTTSFHEVMGVASEAEKFKEFLKELDELTDSWKRAQKAVDE